MKETMKKLQEGGLDISTVLDSLLDIIAETGDIKAVLMKRQRIIWNDVKDIMEKTITSKTDEEAEKVSILFDIIEKAIIRFKKEEK